MGKHYNPLTDPPRCCLCRNELEPGSGGWCKNCDRWPINMTPVRYHGEHRVDPSGFCWTCKDFRLTQLEPTKGEWVDTGFVPRLLTVEERKQLYQKLYAILDKIVLKGQPAARDIEAEKRAILLEEARRQQQQEVPF